MHDYGDSRTLTDVRSFASKTSQNLRMEGERYITYGTTAKKFRGGQSAKRGTYRQTVSSFTRTAGATRGRGGRGPRGGRGAVAVAGVSSRRGISTPTRARGGFRGAATRGRPGAPTTRGAVTRGKSVASFNQTNTLAEATRVANSLGLRGCFGCSAMGHVWEPQFRTCNGGCPFCKKTFTRNETRHFSVLCRKMPKDKAERIKMLKEASSRK